MAEGGKDFWDKLDIALKPIGGLLTAIAVGLLGYYGSSVVENQQSTDARVRLYSELMSKREEAESALRKDMFVSIIQSFMSPTLPAGADNLDHKILNLELLAYNFHEALNLKPLFTYLVRQVADSSDPRAKEYSTRLKRVAREVGRKQMMVLEGAGKKFDRSVDFENLRAHAGGLPLDEATLEVEGIRRNFKVWVIDEDPVHGEIKVRVEISTLGAAAAETHTAEFWVGPYDFPMIDNVRLLQDQRVAIVLNNFDTIGAEITVSYFPGSYASLKEKPYFQEVVRQLLANGLGPDQSVSSTPSKESSP